MTDVNNRADVLDSRDVIARIEELEEEIEGARASAVIHTACRHCGLDIEGSEDDDEWCDRGNNTSCGASEEQAHEPPEGTTGTLPEGELTEEVEELRVLKALAAEAADYSSDWLHGEALIRDSYFVEYAEQLADDIGAIDRKATWPLNCIDWKAAAEQLQLLDSHLKETTMTKHYPLGDYLSLAERNALGMKQQQSLAAPSAPGTRALAIDTGEFRPPRKGEWYLSGAIVTAYRAPNDLATPYHIARIALVEYELTSRVIATI